MKNRQLGGHSELQHPANPSEINWCRRGESNPRPRDYETLALPLSYAGLGQFSMLRSNARECQAHVKHRVRGVEVVSSRFPFFMALF